MTRSLTIELFLCMLLLCSNAWHRMKQTKERICHQSSSDKISEQYINPKNDLNCNAITITVILAAQISMESIARPTSCWEEHDISSQTLSKHRRDLSIRQIIIVPLRRRRIRTAEPLLHRRHHHHLEEYFKNWTEAEWENWVGWWWRYSTRRRLCSPWSNLRFLGDRGRRSLNVR